ncbi:MAG: hypothetical protein HWD59_04905 [Coxiellaceae bacterium]|nr:MAG: hypothetical protein HWD59_04905 [Coxiellaceae bacterium]
MAYQKMAFQNPQSLKIIKPILFLLLQTFSMSILTEIDKDGLNALDYALTNPMFFKALATLYKEHKNLPPLPDYFVHSMVSKRNYRAVTALLSVDPNAIFQQDQDLNTPLHLTLLLLQSKQNTEQQQQELVAIATVLIPIADLSTENSKGQTPPDLFKALPSVIKNKFSLVLRVSMSSTTDDRLEKIMNMLGHKAYEETEAPVIEKASQISESSTNNNNNGEDENDSHDTNEKSFGA